MSPDSYLDQRLASLKNKHSKLKRLVERHRGSADELRELKKRKLLVKDRIASLEKIIRERAGDSPVPQPPVEAEQKDNVGRVKDFSVKRTEKPGSSDFTISPNRGSI